MISYNYKYRIVFLSILIALFLTPNFFFRGLWSPDEPRYAEIARQVWESDNFLLPRLNGELYAEKPPLFFYLAALGNLFMPPNGGRLVEALAFLGIIIILCLLFKKEDKEARFYVPLIFLTFVLSIVCGKFGIIDALLVFFLVLGIYYGRTAMASPRPVLPWILCYTAVGLGTLTKGPVIIPFILLALIGSRKDLKPAAPRKQHLFGNVTGLVAFSIIILLWLVPACIYGGKEYTNILLGQIGGRITGARGSHNHPWFYYLIQSSYVFFPWTLILLFSLSKAWKEKKETLWLLFWFIGGFIILSIFKSKRERYLFLILPAAAMIITHYFIALKFSRFDITVLRITAGLLLFLSVILLLSGPTLHFLPMIKIVYGRLPPVAKEFLAAITPWQTWFLFPFFGLFAFISSTIAWKAVSNRHANSFVIGTTLFVLCANLAFDLALTPTLNKYKSCESFSEDIKSHAKKETTFFLYPSDFDGRFNSFLNRNKIPLIQSSQPQKEIEEKLELNKPVAVIIGFRSRKRSINEVATGKFISGIKGGLLLAKGRLGSRIMILLGNQKASKQSFNKK